MNPKLVGTWFLVRNKIVDKDWDNDHLCICRGTNITPDDSGWIYEDSETGWMDLENENDRFIRKEFKDLTPEDFNALDLPTVTYENSPLEIEIAPSGTVYFY